MESIINNTKQKIESSIHKLHERLSTIIATGASPNMLKNVQIEYYETMTPLNQVANIKAPDATMLMVVPFDKNLTKDIVEAIHKADLGLNPVDEGDAIRIMIPPMTTDKREGFVKETKSIGEEARISIRNIRIDSNKKIKLEELSENEERLAEEKIQNLINDANKEIENIINKKVSDLTSI